MLRFLIRRLFGRVFLFIAVTLVTYVIFFLAPANPERVICGGERARPEVSCDRLARSSRSISRSSFSTKFRIERLVIGPGISVKSYITEQSVKRSSKALRP